MFDQPAIKNKWLDLPNFDLVKIRVFRVDYLIESHRDHYVGDF